MKYAWTPSEKEEMVRQMETIAFRTANLEKAARDPKGRIVYRNAWWINVSELAKYLSFPFPIIFKFD